MRRPVRRYWGSARDGVVSPVRDGWRRVRRLLRGAAIVAVLAGSAVVADRVALWLTTSPAFAVREVGVEGAVNARPDELHRVAAVDGRNVFTLDLALVRQRVLEDPWVEDVDVRRILPGTVRLRVRERVPVGLTREGGESRTFSVLDRRGVVVERGVDRERFRVPVIERGASASDGRVALAARTVAAVAAAEPEWLATVDRVDASADRLTFHVEGRAPVHLGGPESVDELSGWLLHRKALGRELGRVRAVDARWSDRLFLEPDGT